MAAQRASARLDHGVCACKCSRRNKHGARMKGKEAATHAVGPFADEAALDAALARAEPRPRGGSGDRAGRHRRARRRRQDGPEPCPHGAARPRRRSASSPSRASPSPASRGALEADGIATHKADLLDRDAVAALPDADNVVFMAGRKFGSEGAEHLTWAMNALVPALVAERYRKARIVAFSTGCVYPFWPVDSDSGPDESVAPVPPPGDYAWSCVARERVFEHGSATLRHARPADPPELCDRHALRRAPRRRAARCSPASRSTSPWGTST